MAPDQLELRRERAREYQRNLTPEQRERKRERDRGRYSPERKEQVLARSREYHRKRYATPEGKAIIRTRDLKRKYGITPDQWADMFAAQGSCCAICKTTEPGAGGRNWHTDHCHTTEKVRAILCQGCNTGLGGFKENPKSLQAAIDYLAASGGH